MPLSGFVLALVLSASTALCKYPTGQPPTIWDYALFAI